MSSLTSRQLADLAERVALLERHMHQLLAAMPRDAADSALRQALALTTEGADFAAADLFNHARWHPDLAGALAEATIGSTQELGAWLRDHIGVRDDIAVERLRRRRWRVVYTSRTSRARAESLG